MINKKPINSNNGSSTAVEFILIILAVFWVLIMVLDFGFYFATRAAIGDHAQEGARLVSVYGGASSTRVSAAYGVSQITSTGEIVASNYVEKKVALSLIESNITNAKIVRVEASPGHTTQVGEIVSCVIVWEYKGLPGSIFLNKNAERRYVATAVSEVLAEP